MSSSLLILLFSFCILVHSSSVSSLFDLLLADGRLDWDVCYPVTPDFLITWKFVPENDTINLGVASRSVGYIGLGFNSQESMIGTDATIVRFQNGIDPDIGDYYLSDQQPCGGRRRSLRGVCLDSVYGATNNVPGLLVWGRNETAPTTWFAFNRYRTAQDAKYDMTVPTNSKVDIIWSFGDSDDLQEHSPNSRGTLEFNLGNPGLLCPRNCSGHGRCIGACCLCDTHWSGDDCSISSNDTTPFTFDFNTTTITPSEYQFFGELDSDLKIYWNVLYDPTGRGYLDVGLHYYGTDSGWIGLGFGKHMTEADVVVCVVSSSPSVADWTFSGRNTKGTQLDSSEKQANGAPGHDDILASQTAVQDGIQCRFRRFLNTEDSLDAVISDEKTSCIWAVRDQPDWLQHEFRYRGRVKINFFNGDIVKETNYWPVHGILMFLSWGAFMPMAALLARNFKWIGHPWFEIHRVVQTISVMMSAAAFALAIIMKDRDDTGHFAGPHQIIGLVLFIIGGIQPFLGQLADFMWQEGREKTPLFPDLFHGYLGWGGIGLAVANIFLGLHKYQSSATVWILYIIWAGLLLVVTLGVQGLDMMNVFPKKS